MWIAAICSKYSRPCSRAVFTFALYSPSTDHAEVATEKGTAWALVLRWFGAKHRCNNHASSCFQGKAGAKGASTRSSTTTEKSPKAQKGGGTCPSVLEHVLWPRETQISHATLVTASEMAGAAGILKAVLFQVPSRRLLPCLL